MSVDKKAKQFNEAVQELGAAYDDYFELAVTLQSDGNRVLDDPKIDQTWRRNVVRVTWPMIEAYASILRRFCGVFRKHCDVNISTKQEQLLDDESSFTNANRIKESLKIAYRLHDLGLMPNFGDQNWQNVRKAIDVRDRITHPKFPQDLEINDDEWKQVHGGLTWMLQRFTHFFKFVKQKYGVTS